jgi:predicted GNAT superfamily acetyltransferase
MSAYEIRPFATIEEYQACVALQEEVWGVGFSERVSLAILKVSQRLGGVAAGAFDAGRLIGFVFGMTGIEDGRPVHWSDMLAVRSGRKDSGLGTALKAYQRRRMLELGVGTVYWTWDPLQSRNAYLNLGKLGVVVREYQQNMYGEVTDSPLHEGIGTDRFVALWLIETERVEARLSGREQPPDLERFANVPLALGAITEGGLPRPTEPVLDLTGPDVAVTIPASIDDVKARSVEVAADWRRATRAALVYYIERGYEVRELVRDGAVSRYVLHDRNQTGDASP